MEYLSIVIPTFNSRGKLYNLTEKITDALSALEYEIIFVNDASTDDTWSDIESLSEKYSTVKGISLEKNMGQQNAVFAGLYYSKGSFVVTMDDDLEHNPDNIPLLIEKAKEGFDLVYAVCRKQYTLFRKAGSFLHDLFFYAAFRKPFRLKITSFRIINRSLTDKILSTEKIFIYISAVALSFKPSASYISTDAVHVSESRYGKYKLIKLFLNLALNYSFPDFLINIFSRRKGPVSNIILNSVNKKCGIF